MERAKAVVLARGLGTRMREDDASVSVDAAQAEAAARGLKAMMPVVLDTPGASASSTTSGEPPAPAEPNTAATRPRPFLDYILSALADAGYTDICLVIGPDHDRVRDYYTHEAPPTRVRVTFAEQAEPRGTADALLAAEAFAGADDVLVLNGDNYYPIAAMRALRELDEPGTVLFTPDGLSGRGNIAPDRIRAFAIGRLTPDHHLADIVEKPDSETLRAMAAASGGVPLVSMNCWRLPAAIFPLCRHARPSPRGELELSLAIRDGVRLHGLRLAVLRSEEGVLDLSRRADITSVAAHLRGIEVRP